MDYHEQSLSYFVASFILCASFGYLFSLQSVWNYFFFSYETYLKAGEYGEADSKAAGTGACNKSLWKEPLNAWTSLAYSAFGFVIFFTGLIDASTPVGGPIAEPVNTIAVNPSFSVLFGLSCVYLGAASFLFHASHSEVWRKADAGMTSGVAVVIATFSVYQRGRVPGLTSGVMVALTVLLQLSLTHGYLPYGSSDILLPSLIGTCWLLELFPRYGGLPGPAEYTYWLEAFYYAVGGMLLRATDIKRKQPVVACRLLCLFVIVSVLFGLFLGPTNVYLLLGLVGGAYVYVLPERGHVCWHIFSAFALYHWWEMLRGQPGPPTGGEPGDNRIVLIDLQLVDIAFFVTVVNAVRRLLMTISGLAAETQSKFLSAIIHLFFAAYGAKIIVDINMKNEGDTGGLSRNSSVYLSDLLPNDDVRLFVLMRAAACVEDLLSALATCYWGARVSKGSTSPTRSAHKDVLTACLALLTVGLYLNGSGSLKFCVLVMFLLDASELPMDLRSLCGTATAGGSGCLIVRRVLLLLTALVWTVARLYAWPVVAISIAVDKLRKAEEEKTTEIVWMSLVITLCVVYVLLCLEFLQLLAGALAGDTSPSQKDKRVQSIPVWNAEERALLTGTA